LRRPRSMRLKRTSRSRATSCCTSSPKRRQRSAVLRSRVISPSAGSGLQCWRLRAAPSAADGIASLRCQRDRSRRP
jgi:hypothetical protein